MGKTFRSGNRCFCHFFNICKQRGLQYIAFNTRPYIGHVLENIDAVCKKGIPLKEITLFHGDRYDIEDEVMEEKKSMLEFSLPITKGQANGKELWHMDASDEAKKKLIAGYEKYEATLQRKSEMNEDALTQEECSWSRPDMSSAATSSSHWLDKRVKLMCS